MPVKDKIAFFEGRQNSEQETEDDDGFAVFPERNEVQFRRRDSIDEGTAERQGKKFLLPSMMRTPSVPGITGAQQQPRHTPASDIWGAFNDLSTNSRNTVAMPGMTRLRPGAGGNNHTSSFFSRHAQAAPSSGAEQPLSSDTIVLANSSSRHCLPDKPPATTFTSATAGLASAGGKRNHLEGPSGRTWGIAAPARFSYHTQTSADQQARPPSSDHSDFPSTLTASKRRALEAAVGNAHIADFSQLPLDGGPSVHSGQGDNRDRKLLYAQRMRAGFMRSGGLGQFTPKRPDQGMG